jgi:hypothetical protein
MPDSGGNALVCYFKEIFFSFILIQQDKSVAVDKDAQIKECVYYQWDTIQQRLHVIQKRSPTLTKTMPANGHEALVYMAYTINARGQFDATVCKNFQSDKIQ